MIWTWFCPYKRNEETDSKKVSTPYLQLIFSLSKDFILVSSVLLGKVVNKVVSAGLFGNRRRDVRNLNVFKVQEAKFQLHSNQSVHIWFCELTCHLFSHKSIQAISPNTELVNKKRKEFINIIVKDDAFIQAAHKW